jgi:hypothetical protein
MRPSVSTLRSRRRRRDLRRRPLPCRGRTGCPRSERECPAFPRNPPYGSPCSGNGLWRWATVSPCT